MSGNPNFPADYIDFESRENEVEAFKTLTFIGASAVSLLCYESEDKAASVLRDDDRFKLVRTQEIVSAVWSVANVAAAIQPNADNHPVPLLAWSTRLETLFLAFRGTQSVADVLSDVNILQEAQPDLGSRFHAGFLARASPYTALIKHLVKTYKVVVCGHSLGGAMATIATYLVLATECGFRSMPNSWDAGDKGLSAVTFGSPPAMVVEEPGTTATPRKDWTRNFHHVINPDDYIPFVLDQSTERAEKIATIAANAFIKALPVLEPVKDRLVDLLKFWMKARGKFAHFGCLYLLENNGPRINCHRITARRQIPSLPDVSKVNTFHSMAHYANCLSRTPRQNQQFPAINPTTSMSPEKFRWRCLPLDNIVHECTGVADDNRIVMSIRIDSRLVQFFVTKLTFNWRGNEVQVSKMNFVPNVDHHDQTLVNFQYDLDPAATTGEVLALVNSIREELRIHDTFGQSAAVSVGEISSASLRHVTVPTTFESIRLAMIIAYADQVAKVQALKLSQTGANEINRKEAAVLTEHARSIANRVDATVSNACPHLVVGRLGNACKLLKELWPKSNLHEKENGSQPTTPTRNLKAGPGVMPGTFSEPEEIQQATRQKGLFSKRIPISCPDDLRWLMQHIVSQIDQEGFREATFDEWAEKRWKLVDFVPKDKLFSKALEEFGQRFYDRTDDPEQRTERAIEQARDVLSAMRFCHLIILTQLDVPDGNDTPHCDWFFRYKGPLLPFAYGSGGAAGVLVALPIGFAIEGALAVGLVCVGGLGAIVALGLLIATHVYSKSSTTELCGLRFKGWLEISLQALRIQPPPPNIFVEMPMAKYLEDKMSKAENMNTLQNLQQKLKEGFKENDLPGGEHIDPTLYWAKWLFNVARVGMLRETMSAQIRVGIEGPTEAGKSELLTVLTGAPENVFRSGSAANCRTMEIQSYHPPGHNAVFVDCPGTDDKDARIRELACILRETFGVVIFVVPSDKTRSTATQETLRDIADFLRKREDYRPIRILLGKADQFNFHSKKEAVFHDAIIESKKIIIDELKRLGPLEEDFGVRSRCMRGGFLDFETENLNDIVQAFSTHAQMSLDGKKALSDCPPEEDRMIESRSKFQTLHRMAEDGKIWDIESLRSWLRTLSPNSVPSSARRPCQIYDRSKS